jgi:gluconokinase
MLADVFGKEVYVSESHHSAAWAAAWTGLVALGKADSFAEIKKNVLIGEAVKPNMENHKIYSKIFNKYEMLANDISKYF